MNPLSLLLLLLSLSIRPAFSTPPEPPSLRLNLIRDPRDPLQTRTDHIRDLVQYDRNRHRYISATINRNKRPDCFGSSPPPPPPPPPPPVTESFAMPLSSGAYTGTGQYFVRVRVGTPAQRFLLVADTGSDLTWVNCKYRNNNQTCAHNERCGSSRRLKRVFDAVRSRSFHPISCSSEMCQTQMPFALATCPSPASPCSYNYGYADGSGARGFFANESATIALTNGRKKKLKGLIIGCTSSSVGNSFRQSDGVLGLGHSNISFASRAASHFSGKFSYCLVDHLSPKNFSAYLTFGANNWLNSSAARQTELLTDIEPFFFVRIVGISVDGKMLKIPKSVWDVSQRGGTILDSGTSLSILAEPAYEAVTTALSRRLNGIPRVDVDVDPFDYCYNWTNVASFDAPKLAIHFIGSARLEPPAKSYLIDVADGVKCLGFVSTPAPGQSTIGNIMQQEHLWEFDVWNRRLRFQRSTCGPH